MIFCPDSKAAGFSKAILISAATYGPTLAGKNTQVLDH